MIKSQAANLANSNSREGTRKRQRRQHPEPQETRILPSSVVIVVENKAHIERFTVPPMERLVGVAESKITSHTNAKVMASDRVLVQMFVNLKLECYVFTHLRPHPKKKTLLL